MKGKDIVPDRRTVKLPPMENVSLELYKPAGNKIKEDLNNMFGHVTYNNIRKNKDISGIRKAQIYKLRNIPYLDIDLYNIEYDIIREYMSQYTQFKECRTYEFDSDNKYRCIIYTMEV